jgi:hypothetical protein
MIGLEWRLDEDNVFDIQRWGVKQIRFMDWSA